MNFKAKDFVPARTKGGLFKSSQVQNFDDVVKDMNDWINANPGITVKSIETVVLPNIHDKEEEGSMDTELYTGGESSSMWYQLIRVWYS
jgi:hypothetical protein